MPRVAKANATKPAATAAAKKAPAVKKGKKTYNMPEPIPLGEIITDTSKNQWKIGPSIGVGGFGEIYSACNANASTKNDDKYNYVVKIEPHVNGPLFVEMHFYMRNAQLSHIRKYIEQKKIKTLGMPHLVASGSHDINNLKHRFLVLPRYGTDIESLFIENGKKIPEHTIYRLALQMLDVYEFIHDATYAHGDLKAQNMLLGRGKDGDHQVYLVDFGLASHYTKKDFKPDPKKMHNGTSDYTSRDAHYGIPTMRGDFEILGYNLLHWYGVALPWEGWTVSNKVQQAKEEFMKNINNGALQKLSTNTIPEPICKFLKYVQTLEFNDVPNYNKCKELFLKGLEGLGKKNSGPLDFKHVPITTQSKNAIKPKMKNIKTFMVKNESEDSENDMIQGTPQQNRVTRTSLMKRKLQQENSLSPSPSPTKSNKNSLKPSTSSTAETLGNENKSHRGVHTINFSAQEGKTVININITPHKKKTYELDISADANLIVNVKKKKRTKNDEMNPEEINKNDLQQPRIRLRKYNAESAGSVQTKK